MKNDLISRYAAIEAFGLSEKTRKYGGDHSGYDTMMLYEIQNVLEGLPSVQPEPLSDAYMKAVWTWLLDYQIKVAELKGRYTPYEVLSWVANDWRKEHDGSD